MRRASSGAEREQRDHGLEARRTGAARGTPLRIAQVGLDVQMRKQPRVLEHVADAAPLRRDLDAARRVEQHLVVELDAARVGARADRR